MIRIILLVYFFALLIHSSCSRVADHEVLADQKIFTFAKNVKKTDQLELFMYGGGLYEKINSLNIGFISHELVDIDSARRMYVDLSNRFLNYVNSDPNLSQYSSVFPFTNAQLNLVIMYKPYVNQINSPFISGVSMGEMYLPKRESIFYHQNDPYTGKSEIVLIESYNKALEILKFQQCQQEMDAELRGQEVL